MALLKREGRDEELQRVSFDGVEKGSYAEVSYTNDSDQLSKAKGEVTDIGSVSRKRSRTRYITVGGQNVRSNQSPTVRMRVTI